MKILGIETSCDETAASIVTDKREILSNLVQSQIREHKATQGVVPEVAARAHLDHLDPLIKRAMSEAGLKSFADLDGIAVTAGPGLIGGVMVGVMTAKGLAAATNKPLIAVNHLEGHALTVRLTGEAAFPYLLLLVSGGHCQLLAVEGVGKYHRLGTTIDDAVGEAFDKTAKLLGLGYPGGPAVEREAQLCPDIEKARLEYPLPRPLYGRDGCDFSFSGLKTAVRRHVEQAKINALTDAHAVHALAASFQETVAAILADRTQNACTAFKQRYPSIKNPPLVVAGGVAANKRLRRELEDLARQEGFVFAAPPLHLCGDNAAMIAWAGVERLKLGLTDGFDFPARPRWPLDGSVL